MAHPREAAGDRMLLALALGFLLGYLGTIPAMGPLAVLVFATALSGRTRRALALGLGGAIAEGLWAFGAARGLGWLLAAHPVVERALRSGGGALAIAMGLAMVTSLAKSPGAPTERHAVSALGTGFLLVALNPSFLATWLASCALLRASPSLALAAEHAPLLAAGAAAGVVAWFATLTALVSRHRGALSAWHGRLARALGWTLVALGVVALVHAARSAL